MIRSLNKTSIFILMFVGMLGITTGVKAQEGGMILGEPIQEKPKQMIPSSEDGDINLKEQPVLKAKSTSTEDKNNNTAEQAPDIIKTTVTKPKKPAIVEEKKEVVKEEESVLTFNFLYYIIQKFKFDEVIDQ